MENLSTRYLAFVDYLGTRALYGEVPQNGARIQDRRYELEHGIHFQLQRAIAERKIEIGVFSDTVLIAGKDLSDVLTSSAKLLMFSFSKSLRRRDAGDIRLLRGGVSQGTALRSGYLKPGGGISIIPFFDGSLAFAFELEDLRRGSRLFIDNNIAREDLGALEKFTFVWEQMTGYGRPVGGIRELLWPALCCDNDIAALKNLLVDSFALWREFAGADIPDADRYRATLYHFDETIKLIVRSWIVAGNQADAKTILDALTACLPTPDDAMDECNIRFIWGIWFQIAYVAARLGLEEQMRGPIVFMLKEIKRRGYWENFVAEMDYPDYQGMLFLIGWI